MNVALVTHIEGNSINAKNFNLKYDYEKEAILAFKSWRKNGGYLKDIPIYAICLTKNTISKETQEELKKLNVTYIEDYQSETDNFKNGFEIIPFLGKYISKKIKSYEFIIHIDLDMYLFKELDNSLFDYNKITIGGHTKNFHFYLENNFQNIKNIKHPFMNTGFMIIPQQFRENFFNDFYNKFKELEKLFFEKKIYKEYNLKVDYEIDQKSHLEYLLLEELSPSFLNYNFKIIPDILIEENELNSELKNKACFYHKHIKNLKDYLKINKIILKLSKKFHLNKRSSEDELFENYKNIFLKIANNKDSALPEKFKEKLDKKIFFEDIINEYQYPFFSFEPYLFFTEKYKIIYKPNLYKYKKEFLSYKNKEFIYGKFLSLFKKIEGKLIFENNSFLIFERDTKIDLKKVNLKKIKKIFEYVYNNNFSIIFEEDSFYKNSFKIKDFLTDKYFNILKFGDVLDIKNFCYSKDAFLEIMKKRSFKHVFSTNQFYDLRSFAFFKNNKKLKNEKIEKNSIDRFCAPLNILIDIDEKYLTANFIEKLYIFYKTLIIGKSYNSKIKLFINCENSKILKKKLNNRNYMFIDFKKFDENFLKENYYNFIKKGNVLFLKNCFINPFLSHDFFHEIKTAEIHCRVEDNYFYYNFFKDNIGYEFIVGAYRDKDVNFKTIQSTFKNKLHIKNLFDPFFERQNYLYNIELFDKDLIPKTIFFIKNII